MYLKFKYQLKTTELESALQFSVILHEITEIDLLAPDQVYYTQH